RAMLLTDVRDPKSVAKVGDTPADLLSGEAAGCGWIIGITSGSHTRAQLEPYTHTHLIERLEELSAGVLRPPAPWKSGTQRPRLALAILLLTSLAIGGSESPRAQSGEERVVLITLDGVRTEEIFGGLNLEILRSTLEPNRHAEDTPIYKRFWAQTREERRRR